MEKSSDLNSVEITENSENESVGYSSYKVKYITKSGEIKFYEYKSKYIRKGHGLNINKQILKEYGDIVNDDTIKAIDKALKIYDKLSPEDRKKTSIEKIRAFMYRHEYSRHP